MWSHGKRSWCAVVRWTSLTIELNTLKCQVLITWGIRIFSVLRLFSKQYEVALHNYGLCLRMNNYTQQEFQKEWENMLHLHPVEVHEVQQQHCLVNCTLQWMLIPNPHFFSWDDYLIVLCLVHFSNSSRTLLYWRNRLGSFIISTVFLVYSASYNYLKCLSINSSSSHLTPELILPFFRLRTESEKRIAWPKPCRTGI